MRPVLMFHSAPQYHLARLRLTIASRWSAEISGAAAVGRDVGRIVVGNIVGNVVVGAGVGQGSAVTPQLVVTQTVPLVPCQGPKDSWIRAVTPHQLRSWSKEDAR